MVKLIADAVGLFVNKPVNLNYTVHKENFGALVISETDPPQYTPKYNNSIVKKVCWK